VCRLRRQKRWGPARIAARTGVPASTVHRILVRNGLNRLSWIDRPTGKVIRRYERPQPGDLVHLDVKKAGKVPPGGGWRAHGRANTFTRPYRPQTNGKAERFNRTLSDEFLHNHKFKSEPDRRRRLQTWTHHYNLHRHHTATGRHTRLTRQQSHGHYN